MNTLFLIPSALKTGVEAAVARDQHPTMDYYALADGLRRTGATVTIVDYSQVENAPHPLVKLATRLGGRDAGLAMLGFQQRGAFDTIFTNGENVAIPLAMLLSGARGQRRRDGKKRPGHVTIGHRLSTGKKKLFFQTLGLHRWMDTIFVYATTQRDCGRQLGIPDEKLKLIPFHADQRFYRPLPEVPVQNGQISAAGLEWRDYPTLLAAVEKMPELTVKLAAASPWSKHQNETEKRALPSNVSARRYEYGELRALYASSEFVVVPLYENDFQAGVTTLLEAMAMGKPVIVTQTTGQTDVVTDGVNGLTVPPGDAEAWKTAITRLRRDAALRDTLGSNARRWIEENASLDLWVENIGQAIRQSAGDVSLLVVSAEAREASFPH